MKEEVTIENMSSSEIEEYIQEQVNQRVTHILNDLIDGVQNRIKTFNNIHWNSAMSGDFKNSGKYENFHEAWVTFKQQIQKELDMQSYSISDDPVYREAGMSKKQVAGRKAIDYIYNIVDEENRGKKEREELLRRWFHRMDKAVEMAQDYDKIEFKFNRNISNNEQKIRNNNEFRPKFSEK